MKIFWLVIALCLTALSLQAKNLEGTYHANGWDPYTKTSYDGIFTISHVKDKVYTCKWSLTDGEDYDGTCLLNGNQLSIIFAGESIQLVQAQYIGLCVYTVTPNALEGQWILLNQKLIGTEKMTRTH